MNEMKNIWIEKFLEECKFRHKSENTIGTYKKHLYYFLKFLKTEDIVHATKDQIKSYLATCKSESTFNLNLTTFNMFYNWLQDDEKQITNSPSRTIKHVKVHRKEPKYLREKEDAELFENVDGRYKTRDLAILRVLRNGLRRSEVSKVNIQDIIEIDGDYVLKIISGKGDKPRTVVLFPETMEAIREYLKEDYRQYSKNNALFITQDGKRLSSNAVYKQTKKNMKKVINEGACHALRHTCATDSLFNKGIDIRSIQDLLGHESLATTQLYLQLDDKTRIKNILKK